MYSCPTCKVTLEGQYCLTEKAAKPESGDVSVCVHCITPLMFTEEDTLRLLTPEETDELSKDPLYVRVVFELQKRAAHR